MFTCLLCGKSTVSFEESNTIQPICWSLVKLSMVKSMQQSTGWICLFECELVQSMGQPDGASGDEAGSGGMEGCERSGTVRGTEGGNHT